MVQGSFMSESEIATAIFQSTEAYEKVEAFVNELKRQKILDLFINEDAFGVFLQKISDEDVLHEQFTALEISKSTLIENFVFYYIKAIASNLAQSQVSKDNDINVLVEQMIDMDKDPQNIMSLFLTLLLWSNELAQRYNQAIEFHFQVMDYDCEHIEMTRKKRESFWKKILDFKLELNRLFMDAFPCGAKFYIGCKYWMSQNAKIIDKIDFNGIITQIPYEHIQYYFDNSMSQVIATDKTSTEIQDRQTELFKGILVDDALKCLKEQSKKRTANTINTALTNLFDDSPTYIYIRFVQACYMFYREEHIENEQRRLEEMFRNVPTLFYNGTFRGINIPS